MSANSLSAIPSNFGATDWTIVGLYLIGTVIIGLYANRYIRNMSDYIVPGRSLKSYLAVATMIGSELGLVTVYVLRAEGLYRWVRRLPHRHRRGRGHPHPEPHRTEAIPFAGCISLSIHNHPWRLKYKWKWFLASLSLP